MKICCFPRPLALKPESDESDNDDEVLNIREDVEIVIVLWERGRGVNPRKDKKRVNKGPPRQQQGEIQVSEAGMQFSALAVRLQCQRGHQGDAAQEKKNVARKQARERLVKVNLVISPLKLTDHPESAA